MNIKHLIKFPKEIIISERIYQNDGGTYIPKNTNIYSGVTGRKLGTIKSDIFFSFSENILKAYTLSRFFDVNKYNLLFVELDDYGKPLTTGMRISKQSEIQFIDIESFILDQEIEKQSKMSFYEKKVYKLKNKVLLIPENIFNLAKQIKIKAIINIHKIYNKFKNIK